MWGSLYADGELGLPPGLNTAALPWWAQLLLICAAFGLQGYLLLKVRNTDVRKINTEIDLRLAEAARHDKREDDDSAIGQWKAIARNEIKLRGEAEERHRKEMLETEEKHNRRMADLVGATRAEIHEVRNDLGMRVNRLDAEVAESRRKEWSCQKQMNWLRGVAKANGWDMDGMPDDDEPIPPPEGNGL